MGKIIFITQRLSGIIILLYVACVASEILRGISYDKWIQFMLNPIMQVFTVLAWMSVILHGWMGFKVVLDDYITLYLLGEKAHLLRLILIIIFWLGALFIVVNIADFLRLINEI